MDKKPKRMVPEVRFKGFTDDWEQRKLGEVTTSLKSYSLTRKYETIDTTGYKYIHYGDIHTGKAKKIDNPDKLPSIIKGNYFTLDNGDIVVADASEDYQGIADAAILLNKNMFSIVAGLHTIAFRPNNKLLSSLFAYYTLQTSNFKHYGYRVGTGLKVFGISNEAFFNYSSFYPTFMEQQIISKLLNLVERLITLQQRKLEQLRLLKRAMLQQLFVNNTESLTPNIRFNNFSKDWEQRKGKFIFKSKSVKGYPNLPVLSATQDKGMILRDKSGIDIKFNKKALSNYKKIEPGDFIVHLRSFQGGFAYSDIEGIASPAYTVFSFIDSKEFNDYFWKEKFCSYNFIQLLKKVTYGVRDGRSINYSDFLTLPEKYPLLEEQNKIGNILKKIDNLLSIQQIRAKKLNFLKKFLLQKLFI